MGTTTCRTCQHTHTNKTHKTHKTNNNNKQCNLFFKNVRYTTSHITATQERITANYYKNINDTWIFVSFLLLFYVRRRTQHTQFKSIVLISVCRRRHCRVRRRISNALVLWRGKACATLSNSFFCFFVLFFFSKWDYHHSSPRCIMCGDSGLLPSAPLILYIIHTISSRSLSSAHFAFRCSVHIASFGVYGVRMRWKMLAENNTIATTNGQQTQKKNTVFAHISHRMKNCCLMKLAFCQNLKLASVCMCILTSFAALKNDEYLLIEYSDMLLALDPSMLGTNVSERESERERAEWVRSKFRNKTNKYSSHRERARARAFELPTNGR